jgi:transposase, IS5 family
MKAFDWQLRKKGYIPMAGQIVDASLVPAPKQRNTEGEKAAIKAGKTAGRSGRTSRTRRPRRT